MITVYVIGRTIAKKQFYKVKDVCSKFRKSEQKMELEAGHSIAFNMFVHFVTL